MSSLTLSKKLVQLKDIRSSHVSNDEIKNHFGVRKQLHERSAASKKVEDCKLHNSANQVPGKSSSPVESYSELERLREFDLDATFGPCSGISRMDRWTRAYSFGFNPPVEVRTVILDHPADKRYTESIWFGETI